MNVIAEVKRASPSKGDINQNVDPVDKQSNTKSRVPRAISVLTDRLFFNGSMTDFSEVSYSPIAAAL